MEVTQPGPDARDPPEQELELQVDQRGIRGAHLSGRVGHEEVLPLLEVQPSDPRRRARRPEQPAPAEDVVAVGVQEHAQVAHRHRAPAEGLVGHAGLRQVEGRGSTTSSRRIRPFTMTPRTLSLGIRRTG